MNERRDQIAFDHQQPGTKYRSAQHLPKVRLQANRQALQSDAQRKIVNEAADPSYIGHQAGLHPENRLYLSEELTQSSAGQRNTSSRAQVSLDADADFELEEDESYYNTLLPTSTRRYKEAPIQTRAGRVNVVEHYHDRPYRATRQAYEQQRQLPPAKERHTDAYEIAPQRAGRRLHPLAWFGIFLTLLFLGWMGLNYATSWFQGLQTDWTYGKERHFEVSVVVGHGDSATHPSYFTAENDNGEIIVIELPGGNISKAMIYQIETVPGNTGNPPVKLSFQDMNGDGKADMLVQIGDGSATLFVTLYNTGRQFVSKL